MRVLSGWENICMKMIDLNCDMGEGLPNDALIMPYVSSVNIACGYHAGDEKTMWDTVELAAKHQVAVGAHISFLDRENFGRTETAWDPEELYDLLTQQLILIGDLTQEFDQAFHHVKPHGALYNMSARDPELASLIARVVFDYNPKLILYGLSGSHSVAQAKEEGLEVANEVFADRTYQDNGSLTPRTQPGALIENTDQVVAQVMQMITKGNVTSLSGKQIPIVAETVCIHGDGKNAIEFARSVHVKLKENNFPIGIQN
jgi:5-oxoprolinase (ATP-hydrolysing) subunit A